MLVVLHLLVAGQGAGPDLLAQGGTVDPPVYGPARGSPPTGIKGG
jgi:hypothetical protein